MSRCGGWVYVSVWVCGCVGVWVSMSVWLLKIRTFVLRFE